MMVGVFIGISIGFPGCKKDDKDTVTDIDGNVYHTVTIGAQVWTRENLKVTRYRNGDQITIVIDSIAWDNLSTGAYCDFDNNTENASIYGHLYYWYAVTDSRNLCPAGWHVPTDYEWEILIDFLGGEDSAGGKLKETDTTLWHSPNTGATNISGFSALPGGCRRHDGPVIIAPTTASGGRRQRLMHKRQDTAPWFTTVRAASVTLLARISDLASDVSGIIRGGEVWNR